MLEPLDLGEALGADRPPIQRAVRIPLDADDFPVFHFHQEAAAAMIHPRAKRFNNHFFHRRERRARREIFEYSN
jgi:hypothetical protein